MKNLLIAIVITIAQSFVSDAGQAELQIGQKWSEAQEIIRQLNMTEHPYPQAVYEFPGSSEEHTFKWDDVLVTLYVSPSTQIVTGMKAHFGATNESTRAYIISKRIRSMHVVSEEEYSFQFLRDLRTPEQREKDIRDIHQRIKEIERAAEAKEKAEQGVDGKPPSATQPPR